MATGSEEKAHLLSVIAAEVVRNMADKPGTWDFEKAFRPHLAMLDLKARSTENELSQSSAAAHEGKELYLFKRGMELRAAIEAQKKQLVESQQ